MGVGAWQRLSPVLHPGQALTTHRTSHMWLGSTVVSLVLRKAEPCGHRPVLTTVKRGSQNVVYVRESLGYEDRLASPPGDYAETGPQ